MAAQHAPLSGPAPGPVSGTAFGTAPGAGPAAGPVIVVAPDKFKGSLSAREAAEAVASGLRAALPGAQVRCVPVADGGEGTVEAAVTAGFERRTERLTGPAGEAVTASWALRPAGTAGATGSTGTTGTATEAVVELAQASGIELLPPGGLAPAAATSRGTGELLGAALRAGAQRIVLGLGGSACTDGGAGLLAALGVGLLDADGHPVPDGGGHLHRIHRLSLAGLDPRWRDVELVLASDVDNPLLGPQGAAAVFGPQKGLSAEDVPRYDAGLRHFRDRLAEAAADRWGQDAASRVRRAAGSPGAGAAGGAGFAALAVLGAERRRGIAVVLELVGLETALRGASLVVTGEGSLDEQSLQGKTPVGVARAARAHGIPVEAVCGRTLLNEERARQAGFRRVWSLADVEPDPAASMRRAAGLLAGIGERIGRESLVAGPR